MRSYLVVLLWLIVFWPTEAVGSDASGLREETSQISLAVHQPANCSRPPYETEPIEGEAPRPKYVDWFMDLVMDCREAVRISRLTGAQLEVELGPDWFERTFRSDPPTKLVR